MAVVDIAIDIDRRCRGTRRYSLASAMWFFIGPVRHDIDEQFAKA